MNTRERSMWPGAVELGKAEIDMLNGNNKPNTGRITRICFIVLILKRHLLSSNSTVSVCGPSIIQ